MLFLPLEIKCVSLLPQHFLFFLYSFVILPNSLSLSLSLFFGLIGLIWPVRFMRPDKVHCHIAVQISLSDLHVKLGLDVQSSEVVERDYKNKYN
jgi:hypothetical protein